MKAKRETPAEEIRRIKHWLVELNADWEWMGVTLTDNFLCIYLPPFKGRGDRQHIFYSGQWKLPLSAWRDIEQQVKRAMESKEAKP